MKYGLASCLFLVLLTGCSLEPRYCRPCMDIPQCWRTESDEGSTCANIRWWEELGDPILNALILQALQNNKDLKTAVWRVCEYYSQYVILSSKLYPQIDSDGFAGKERIPVTSFAPPNFNPITPNYRYAFNLDYEIDLWGRVRSLSHEGLAEFLASIENRQNVVLDLVASVARSYITLRQLDRELEIALATLADRKEYLYLATLRFEGGLTSEIEVTQATSLYEETRATVVMLNERIPIQENLISVLLGEPPTCIFRGDAIDQFCLPPQIPAGLPSDLLVRRPDIMEAEYKLIAANAAIGVARAAFFPKISLTGLFGGDSFQLKDLFSRPARAWVIGGEYLQQIFTGWRLTGELNRANAQKQELVYQYEQTILNAFKEVDDSLVSHRQSIELVSVEKKRVAALKEYLKLAWLRYYDGQTDYLTVLDAERELFAGEIELTKAQGQIFLTLVDLYKALGGGWVVDADCCLRQ